VRRDFPYLVIILAVALGVRLYAPWQSVLGGDHTDFLETDAWYHIRLIENQVRNWPWRITLDPYAAPGGQFVPIAPLFDTITATAVFVAGGRDAPVAEIERVAAFVPPVLGTLAVAALWALGHVAFDRRAALLGAALLAIQTGHFLDRTMLGFYDHHALEALLAITTLWTLAVALRSPSSDRAAALAGLSLGLYLLGWSSGAFLVGILGVWLLLFVVLAASSEELAQVARVSVVAALVALVLVLIFQDPRMFRYESQVLGLGALGAIAAVVRIFAARATVSLAGRTATYAAIGLVLAIAAGALWAFSTGVLAQLVTDVGRLAADPRRMGVLEARPLFLYPGVWSWAQPWQFFRAGFYIGLVAWMIFTGRVWRARRPIDLLLWVTTAAMFVATYGQNRFGYYLVPMCALLGGWLATLVLDWGGVAQADERKPRSRASFPLQREVAVIVVAGAMFASNIVPAALVASRPGSLPQYWQAALVWLGERTPPPFSAEGGADYYYARYPRSVLPPPDYSVMNWWDHGYWIVQIAHRVPVANPTQERAPNAARFYAATSERDALDTLAAERSRYVISDWELPFRYTAEGAIMGRFQNVLDWAGARHAGYYEVMYKRVSGAWAPIWVFYEPYYRSMAYRLSVLGGAAGVPAANSATVVVVGERIDNTGLRFKEILSEAMYATYEAAVEAATRPQANGRALVVGLDPWRTPFPIEELTRLREVHAARTPEQNATESPWVRIFEVTAEGR
jgi:dolichyl-diphosphooligosaccharide--protein glycosyltransferase